MIFISCLLPSMKHFLCRIMGTLIVKALNAMVKEVNATEVALEDILSDKVQFCDGRTAVMENAEKRGSTSGIKKKRLRQKSRQRKPGFMESWKRRRKR